MEVYDEHNFYKFIIERLNSFYNNLNEQIYDFKTKQSYSQLKYNPDNLWLNEMGKSKINLDDVFKNGASDVGLINAFIRYCNIDSIGDFDDYLSLRRESINKYTQYPIGTILINLDHDRDESYPRLALLATNYTYLSLAYVIYCDKERGLLLERSVKYSDFMPKTDKFTHVILPKYWYK